MDLRLKLLLSGVIAILIGLAFSFPLLVSNVKPPIRIEMIVDVKYAYFNEQTFSQNIPGLWRNESNPASNKQYLISYIIVLNITNHSDKLAYVDEFDAIAGPKIIPYENGSTDSGSFVWQDPIVSDARTIKYVPFWNQYWQPNESRLIALTGTVSVFPIFVYPWVMRGPLYLYGSVRALAVGSGTYSTAFGLKQVTLQEYGSEFLYNTLISGKQLLQINNSFDVSVQSGS